MAEDDLLDRAAELRRRIDELVPELDRLRAELRDLVGRLAEAGVPEDRIAAVTGIHARKVNRMGRGMQDLVRCTFCDGGVDDVGKLIAGPGVYVCDACLRSADLRPPTAEVCSFCGNGAHQVAGVHVATDGRAAICDRSVDLCLGLVIDEMGGSST